MKNLTSSTKLLKRIISKSGFDIGRLDGIFSKPKTRIPVSARGKIRIAENFDTPLPEDVVQDFEG